jgi:hypothetical protein
MAIVWFDEYAPHLLKHYSNEIIAKPRPDLEEVRLSRHRLSGLFLIATISLPPTAFRNSSSSQVSQFPMVFG